MGDKIISSTRRRFLQASAVMGVSSLIPGLTSSVWTAGSDAPEMATVRVGFIPPTSHAPPVVATLKGFDKEYGVTLVSAKEASQAAVHGKLVSGELDAVYVLCGLPYGLELDITSKAQPMANPVMLNQNGQAITPSATLLERGVTDTSALRKLIVSQALGTYTFAHVSLTGTHAMWLYYRLASADINPLTDTRTAVVPPLQMMVNMYIDNMSGLYVDEPWNARAISDRISSTAATSQDI